MTVAKISASASQVRSLSAAEQEQRLDEALAMSKEGLRQRRPTSLSGGQQQAIALPALWRSPRVPALDGAPFQPRCEMRNEMRSEIRRICKTGLHDHFT